MAIPNITVKKETYSGSEAAKKAIQNWQLVERIKGAGWGEGIFKSTPELMHLSTNEAIMKVLDTPALLEKIEVANVKYTASNATATVLFNRAKSGIPVNIELFDKDVQAAFARKMENWNKKNA